jgi:hypothetical protein
MSTPLFELGFELVLKGLPIRLLHAHYPLREYPSKTRLVYQGSRTTGSGELPENGK